MAQGQNGTKKLLQCGGCKEAQYCSRDCQTKHWSEHKPACKVGPRCSHTSVEADQTRERQTKEHKRRETHHVCL
jgi:hypothetical protein